MKLNNNNRRTEELEKLSCAMEKLYSSNISKNL